MEAASRSISVCYSLKHYSLQLGHFDSHHVQIRCEQLVCNQANFVLSDSSMTYPLQSARPP